MPRPKNIPKSEIYQSFTPARTALNETDDCAVCAVAAVTGRPYSEVHEIMGRLGRRHRRGTPRDITRTALQLLGFQMVRVWQDHFMNARMTPAQRKKQQCLTSHSADRFPGLFRHGERWMITTRSQTHISAIVDGVHCDWSRGRSLRVCDLYRILPLDADPKDALL